MTRTPVEFNDRRFQLLNTTAFFLGEKKRELRIVKPTGDDLKKTIREICASIDASEENDLIEEYDACIENFDENTTDEEKRTKLREMLIECRRILRDFKLEYGFAPGEIDEVHAYGLFSTRNGNIYYRGYPVDIAGQPERLLNMFLSTPGHRLPHYEIMNLDGEGSGSPRKRVSTLRKILRKCSRRDLIKTANYEAERGYKLIID